MPWWKTSHGPRPRPARAISAIPTPNSTSPTRRPGRRGRTTAGDHRDAGADTRPMVPVSRSADGAHLPRRRPDRDRLPPSRGHGTCPGARGLRHVPGRAGRVACATGCRWAWTRRRWMPSCSPTRTSTTAACCRCWSTRGSGARSGAPPRARSSPGSCSWTRRGSRRSSPSARRGASGGTRSGRRSATPATSRPFEEAVELAAEGAASPGGPDPEELLRAAGPIVELGLDDPLYTEDDANATLPMLRHIPYGVGARGGAGRPRHAGRCRAHPGLVHRPDAAHGARRRARHGHRLLR